jgi:protocadherin alpha
MKKGNFSYHRCDFAHRLLDHGCFDHFFPSPSYSPVRDEQLSNKRGDDSDPIQLKPQRIHLRIRPNLPYTVNVQFKQILDYPVDLYYLMDLSKSMEDDKAKLTELGNQLAINMRKITSNFKLGFGSFVDKVVMPYVSTVPDK